VSSRMARATASGSTRPCPFTGTTDTSHPSACRSRQGWATEGCSMALVTRWRPLERRARATPRMARLLASVAQPVKRISSGEASSRAATSARARSTASLARRPSGWLEEGLPQCCRSQGSMASATSGSTGVVAL